MQVSASFLSIRENRKENIFRLVESGADYLHVDIMDGEFVENKTDFEELKRVLPLSASFDVHLMVKDTQKYIEEYTSLHPEYITIHIETEGVLKSIDLIKEKNIKVGLSIKPDTPISKIIPYLPFIDLVLVMSVEPGKGGQKFIYKVTNKINELKRIREIQGYHYMIEVDGGIDDVTAIECKSADILVAGSFITERMDYKKQIEKLNNIG